MADRFYGRVTLRLGLAARDWRRVNEGLVKRGEILLDLRILDRWDSELEGMNSGKEGGGISSLLFGVSRVPQV